MSESIACRNRQSRSAWFIVPIVGLFLIATFLTWHATTTYSPLLLLQHPRPLRSLPNGHIPTPTSSSIFASTPAAAGSLTVQVN